MYQELVDKLSYGIVVLDREFRVEYANKYIENMLGNGCSNGDYKGKVCGNAFSCVSTLADELICGQGEECKRCKLREKLKSIRDGEDFDYKTDEIFRIFRTNGDIIRFRLKGYKLEDSGKNHIVIELQDAEKEESLLSLSQKMEIWNKKLENILDNLKDQVCVLDDELNYIYVNTAFCRAVGRRREEILGKNDYDLVSPALAKICQENNKVVLENGNFSREELVDGEWYHVLKGKVEISKGKYGIFGIIKNISVEKQRDQKYKKKIYIDSLTGLYNRNFFQEEIKKIYREKMFSDEELSMLLLDIDDFKQINDIHGHHVGDKVIKNICSIVKRHTRKNDYPVRMGGDEIAVFIHGNKEAGRKLANRILSEIQELEFSLSEITVSIGVAGRIDYTDTLERMYRRADKAMYESKKMGKGRVTICSNEFFN